MTLLAAPPYRELMEAQPSIDDYISGEKTSLGKYLSLISELKKRERFDWVISLQDKSKSDTIGVRAHIRNKVGSGRAIFYDGYLWDWLDRINVDIRNRETPGIVPPQGSVLKAQTLLSSLPERRVFAVIGAAWEEKRWPTDYWCAFLKELVREGWGVVLNGHGKEEKRIGAEIENNVKSGNILNLVDKLSFYDMAGVASQCSFALGNDTGPLHLAALEGITTIGIFGGTRPEPVGLLMPWFKSITTTCYSVGRGCDKRCTKAAFGTCLRSVTPERLKHLFDRMAS